MSHSAARSQARPGKSTGQKEGAARPEGRGSDGGGSLVSPAAIREVIESVVVAFVLAFLFRTFEAEAFVIPTGSMAPTLMGRHKDLVCPMCGYPFQVSASDEVDAYGRLKGQEVIAGTCPMCRAVVDMGRGNPQGKTYPSYNGDRILVAKFPYYFGDPQRWDVAVFRFPGGAKTNYIKRIVGLPGEAIRIQYGDVYVRRPGESEFTIARKPPEKILAMMQPVYDNDYVLADWIERGWPARWSPWPADPAGWQASADYKSFEVPGSARQTVWLTYAHYVPSDADWERFGTGQGPDKPPRPQLITDFTAYNTEQTRSRGLGGDSFWAGGGLGPPLHWVGDLVVEFDVAADKAAGQLLVALIKGGRQFVCRLDLAAQTATLELPTGETFVAPRGVIRPGRHRIRFANVDAQLLLWIDERLVSFGQPVVYDPALTTKPTAADLHPVRIGSAGAEVRASRLRIFRDIYYIAQTVGSGPEFDLSVAAHLGPEQFLSDPKHWDVFAARHAIDFALHEDQFLALGDNSAASKDSRLWSGDLDPEGRHPYPYVSRDLLIGKALYVYWPHSWHKLPGLPIPFPYFPNFARMGFVR